MPKLKLTDAAVQRLSAPPGERRDYFDAALPAFVLRVSGPTSRRPRGSKSWSFLYRYGGKQKRLTLGEYPRISLAAAREKARAAIGQLEEGDDPAVQKEQAREAAEEEGRNTVEMIFEEFVKRHLQAKHRAPRYIAETRRLFDLHVLPRWRGRPLASISRRDVIELLDAIADRGTPIAANRTRAAISALCNFAIRRGVIEASPAALVERPGAETKRDRVLAPAEIRSVWIGAGELAYPFGPYFRMLLATAQRREEVARMRWCDIDLDEKIWTIPKEMTKPGRAHVVPLSPIALRLLSDCPRAGEHVFSSGQRRLRDRGRPEIARGDAPISGHSYAKRLLDEKIAKLGETVGAWTIHDLRRTAATQMAKLGVNRFVLGRVLNHSDSSVTGVYDRHQYLSEKRHALELWGQEIENLTSPPRVNVVPLRREA